MKAWAVAAVAVAIAVVDRVTKVMVVDLLARGEVIPVVPGFFSLVHVRNPGAAFGFLSSGSSPWRELFLIGVSLAAVAGLLWLLRVTPQARRWERGAVAAVIGGALGNLYDRVVFGEVIDFLDVYVAEWHWPAFNVADSAITVGMCILVAASLFGGGHDVQETSPPAPDPSVRTD